MDFRSKGWLLACIALAGLLMLPSLTSGFAFDDYLFLSMLKGKWPIPMPVYDLYSLIGHDSLRFIEEGFYPWWTHPDLKISFFRPLSSLLLGMDYYLFNDHAWLYHLHSLLWLIALLHAFGLLYAHFLPKWAALLALVLSALDDSHGMAAYWISNRHALIGAVPCFYALYAHVLWRESNWRWGLPLSVLGYCLGFLGSEMALSAGAYVVSYELFKTELPWKNRFAALMPLIAVSFLYFCVYQYLEKGVFASGFYIDPIREPVQYLQEGILRLPILLADMVWKFPADLWFVSTTIRPVQIVLGVTGISIFLYLFKDRSLRWLLAGSMISLIPVIATPPSSRQLLCASFGATAVVASFIWSWLKRKGSPSIALKIQSCLIIAIAMAYMVISPAILLFSQFNFAASSQSIASLPDQLPVLENRNYFVLAAPDHVIGVLYPSISHHVGQRVSVGWRTFSMAPHRHVVKRTSPRDVEMRVLDGQMLGSDIEKFWRSPTFVFKQGDKIFLKGMSIEILELENGKPVRINCHFDSPLESLNGDFLIWKEGKLNKIALPDLNESLYLPKESGPSGL